MTFKVRVTNSGSIAANNIVVSNIIPNGFVYASSTLPGTPSTDPIKNKVSWVVPSIAGNSVAEYTVVIKLDTSLPGAGLKVDSIVDNQVVVATGTTSTPSYISLVAGADRATSSFKIAGIPSVKLTQTITSPANATVV